MAKTKPVKYCVKCEEEFDYYWRYCPKCGRLMEEKDIKTPEAMRQELKNKLYDLTSDKIVQLEKLIDKIEKKIPEPISYEDNVKIHYFEAIDYKNLPLGYASPYGDINTEEERLKLINRIKYLKDKQKEFGYWKKMCVDIRDILLHIREIK